MRLVPVAPLESVIGILALCAIATSFRKLDNRRIREKVVNCSMGASSISRDDRACEASSASDSSKNLWRRFVTENWSRSTRLSLAACRATSFVLHLTATISYFLRERRRLWSSSLEVLGERFTLVTKSTFASLQTRLSWLTCCELTFGFGIKF